MKTLTFRGFLVLAAVLTVLGGVRAGTRRHDRTDQQHLDLGEQYPMVGAMRGDVFGSGTLIGAQWAITAAHVVDGRLGNPGDVKFDIGGQRYFGSEVLVPVNWNPNKIDDGWDIALVKLDRPVANVGPSALSEQANILGEEATLTGFGRSGTGLTGASTSQGVKRAGRNTIDRYYWGMQTRIVMADFDHPTDPSFSGFGNTTAIDLEYCLAGGDSGGGLFVDNGGTPELAGINSILIPLNGGDAEDSTYGDGMGFTRVYSFLGWIEDKIDANGPETAWDGGSGNWVFDNNWTEGAPDATTGAIVEGGTAQVMTGGAADFLIVGRTGAGAVTQSNGTMTVSRSVTLGGATTGDGTYTLSGGVLDAPAVFVGYEGAGALRLTGSNARVDTEVLAFGLDGSLEAAAGSSAHLTGPAMVAIASDDASAMAGLENVTLVFEGGVDHDSTLEIASQDRGPTMDGYDDNFALGTLEVGGTNPADVVLVDEFFNSGVDEALYLDTLVLNPGSTLDLDGQTLYVRTIDDNGGALVENGGQWWRMVTLGDFNGDGALNGLDIPDFKAALADTEAWQSQSHISAIMAGDFTGDGAFNGLDIPGFKQALGSGVAAVPEPGVGLLVLTGIVGVNAILRHRGRHLHR